MKFRYTTMVIVLGALIGVGQHEAKGDPCGMVPPIDWAAQNPAMRFDVQAQIKRVGAQMTYVFYRHGLESIVLRPGFSGNVDEFGMLIPFPSPPAVRKVPDNVFEHIAAAIDPPEVVVDLRPQMFGGGGFGGGGFGGGGGGLGGGGGGFGFQLQKDEVRVIREEAVGMYEVAVLAAGSEKALKRWMEDHQFVYPSGMDAVCPEYIEQRWCFVAVKTKVKQKRASDPRPGQRSIENALPEDATFDGHVQAMGFRFRTPELVVPMRLSVHNSGKLRNVVYLLTDKPSKIRNIPEEFVRRQISGFKLFDQMTKPLPLRVLGGKVNDIPRSTLLGLARRRDPEPHNGVAAELFASDLIAGRTKELESKSEAYEKHLFAINEALELRGAEIDEAVRRQIRRTRARVTHSALKAIDELTLTVIDGDFPRDVLARENLTFAEYQMPLERSNRQHYDANKLGRAEPVDGEQHIGLLPSLDERAIATNVPGGDQQVHSSASRFRWSWLTCAIAALVTGSIVALRRPDRRRAVIVSSLVIAVVSTSVLVVRGADVKVPAFNVLVKRLGNPATAERASEQIGQLGESAVPAMIKQSRSSNLVTRGWAIVSLGRIGGDEAKSYLKRIHSHESVPPLVQSWASAALVQTAGNSQELEELSRLVGGKPELARPILLAFRRLAREDEESLTVESLLALGRRVPLLKQGVAETLSAESSEATVNEYFGSQSLHSLVSLANEFPQLGAPIAAAACRQIEVKSGVDRFEARLIAASHSSQFAQTLSGEVLSSGVQPLLRTMLGSSDASVRRSAAGYIATLGQSPDVSKSIAVDVAAAFKFDPSAEKSPWHGGALFIPSIRWQKTEASELVDNLIRWHLWAERNADRTTQQQIDTNLSSVSLSQVAGYSANVYSSTRGWLESWNRVVGAKKMRQLLAEQGVEADYAELLGE